MNAVDDDTEDMHFVILTNGDGFEVWVLWHQKWLSGNSMIDAIIREDDVLVVVDTGKSPKHKDIVIASVDGELTVKRLYRQNGAIMLVPENPDYDPRLIVAPETRKSLMQHIATPCNAMQHRATQRSAKTEKNHQI